MNSFKKIFIIISIICINVSSMNFSFAANDAIFSGNVQKDNDKIKQSINPNPKGAAIDKFRESKMEMINKIYEEAPDTENMITKKQADKQLKDMSTQFDTLMDSVDDLEKKRDVMGDKYKDLVQSLIDIVNDVRKSKVEINNRINRIGLYDEKLNRLNEYLETLQDGLTQSKRHLGEYTSVLYKINNDFYGSDLNIDNLKLLVKSDNIVTSLSDEDMVKAMAVKLDELVDIMSKDQVKYQKYATQLMKLKTQYNEEISQYKKDIELLAQQKKYVVDMIHLIKENKNELDQKLNGLMDDKKQIRNQIINVMNTLSNTDNVKSDGIIGKNLAKLIASEEKDDGETFLTWPIAGARRITTFFDDMDYEKIFGVLHKAIDVAVPQGSEVYAPADGIVYKVMDKDWTNVNYLIMYHKHGYVTVYLHMNKVLVKEGDYVKRGEIIGISGGKPGTRGAGFLSTGPHLHFEVIKNGQYLDPLAVMDLSIYNSEDSLLPKYNNKYQRDKLGRQIDLDGVKPLAGNTLEKRRINFLYAAIEEFRDVSMWEQAADAAGIDPDLGICVGYAETGLGNNLSSKLNIGNVGNNDRGDRKNFNQAQDAVKGIYYTLANRLLSDNYTLDQMSRYGNKDGRIYASSDYNWHKNIVKCLTRIKGYNVPDDFAFRLYKR